MEPSEPLLTRDEKDALRWQRPPERFAERVMRGVARDRALRTRRRRAALGVGLLTAASVAGIALLSSRSSAEHGDVRADVRAEVRVGPRAVAVLERGAHVRWDGDDVTQLGGEVFYRVEPGGARRVHTSAGDIVVHGTCFDVKVRGEGQEDAAMTRRDAVAGTLGAALGAAVLVGVYEGRVTLSRAEASVHIAAGQGARADAHGLHGPEDWAAAQQGFAASSGDEPWRLANANLADELKSYQARLERNESEKRAIEKELKVLKAKASAAAAEAGAPRDPLKVDPRDLTQDDWKALARQGRVRASFLCPPAGWQPTADQLTKIGLAPGDGPALERAVAASQDRMWQAVGPECARILNSPEVAKRLGAEMCGMILQTYIPAAEADKRTRLVADIRAGNTPMPAESQIDPFTARLLALTSATASFEKDLTTDFGPGVAHRIAREEDLDIGCGLEFAP